MANPSTALAVGEVKSTRGEVFARSMDGHVRRLSAGDRIFEGEVIVTASGSSAEINMLNGAMLNVAEQQSVAVDSQAAAPAQDATAGVISGLGSTEAAKVIQTTGTGEQQDFEALLAAQAAAAGLAGGEGGGGTSFVDLARIVEAVPTTGYSFPVNPAGTAPTIEGQAGVPLTTATVNQAPIVDVVAAATFTEGSARAGDIAFTYSGSDPDTPASQLVYTLINDNNGYLAMGENNTIVLTAAGAAAINADVPISSLLAAVQVSDGSLTASDSDTTTVVAVNDGPIVDVVAAATFTEGSASAGDVAFTYSGSDPDTPASQLVYTLTNDNNGYLAMGANNTIVLTAAGAAAINADTPISSLLATVQVSDGSLTASDSDTTTVAPVNDNPTISINNEGQNVYEAGLLGGSHLGNTLTAVTGTFTIGDPDATDNPVITTGTFAGDHGSLTISLDSEGIYHWTYNLTSNVDNDSTGSNIEPGTDSFTVTVNDGRGGSAAAVLTVGIVDDVPSISGTMDGFMSNQAMTLYGTTGLIDGADSLASLTVMPTLPAGWTSTAVTHTGSDGSVIDTQVTIKTGSSPSAPTYGILTVEADGDYSFQLINPQPIKYVSASLSNLTPGGPHDPVVLDLMTGSSVYATATFTSPGDAQINSSKQGMGIDNNWVEDPKNAPAEWLYATFDRDLTDIGFTAGNLTNKGGQGESLIWQAWNNGTMVDSGTYTPPAGTGESDDTTFYLSQNGLNSGTVFDEVRLSAASGDDYRLLTMSVQTQEAPSAQAMNFALNVMDNDGDTASGMLNVSVAGGEGPGYMLTGSPYDDVLLGGTGGDTLSGGTGNDIMTGGAGVDTFVWKFTDVPPGTATDKVTDFSATDKLDLSDLVMNHSANVHFSDYDADAHAITVTATSDTHTQIIEVMFDASVTNPNLVHDSGIVTIG